MIVGGVAREVLALVGLGFAMAATRRRRRNSSAEGGPRRRRGPWNDPSMMERDGRGEAAQGGAKEQDKSGEVDLTKVDPGGGK